MFWLLLLLLLGDNKIIMCMIIIVESHVEYVVEVALIMLVLSESKNWWAINGLCYLSNSVLHIGITHHPYLASYALYTIPLFHELLF